MSSISFNFDNVYLLFLAIPLVLVFTVPLIVIFAVKRDNRNGHSIASIALHAVMAVLIAFAAAGTSVITTMTQTDVYVVADVSYSANKNLDLVDEYVKNIKLPPNSRKGVICFGKDFRIITPLGERFTTVKNSGVDDTETNISGALEYAGKWFRDDVIKRIVLITDGKQTYESDSNELKRTVDGLTQKGIIVDAIFLDDNVRGEIKEVQITGAEYSRKVFLNNKETVSAVIQSSYSTGAVCTLYLNGEKIEQRAANLTAGSNYVTFDKLVTAEAGSYDYKIDVKVSEDENSNNNEFSFTQTVAESMNILLLTGKQEDCAAFGELYGDGAEIDAYVNEYEVPCSIEALCKYDKIIISDYDVTRVNSGTMFMQSLDTAVSLFGKSLLTFGNTGLQNDENGQYNPLSDMLPVNYGNVNQSNKLFTIVLDGSRSMFQTDRFKRAKRAACWLVDSLNDGDYVCIVVFHGEYNVIQPPAPVSDRENIKDKINNLGVTQGTYISYGLEQAFEQMRALTDFNQKQVMLISDGLSSTLETDNPLDIVRRMYAYGIVTSSIDIAWGNNAPPDQQAGKAKALLENIAITGGGTYFPANDEGLLEDVVFKEIENKDKDYEVNRESLITVNRPRDEAVSGIVDDLTAPSIYVRGYMNSKAKASANTVLSVTYQNDDGAEYPVPLYAYWSYGNGMTSSFTSSISGNWISAVKNDKGGLYGKLFGGVLDAAVPEEKIDYPFVTELTRENGKANLAVVPAVVRPDAKASVKVTLPDGEVKEAEMVYTSFGYNYGFRAYDTGRYTLEVTYSYADRDYSSLITLDVPYLSEYDSFTVFEASGLYKMLAGTAGKVSEDGTLAIENNEDEIGKYVSYLTVPLMIVCVALFAVDVIVRKLKWEDIRSLFSKVNK